MRTQKEFSMKSLRRLCLILNLCICTFPAVSQAFYQPGALKYQVEISPPPSQEGVPGSYWKMEEGVLLYYFEHGRGKPVLVIHGGPGIPPYRSWEGLRFLGDEYHAYYYHQRGCGSSSRPIDSFSSDDYYENMQTLDRNLGMAAQLMDIERIRRILNQDKLILIGHSFGGFIAALYAVEFPEHVEKMVLISPAGLLQFPPAHGGMDVVKEYLRESQKRAYDEFVTRYFDYGSIFQKNEQELSKLNRQYDLFYLQALEEKGIVVPESAAELQENGGWSVHALYIAMGQRYDHRDKLSSVQAPVLILHGARDIYPVEISREYASLFPNGGLRVFDNASHFVFEEKPEDFARVVRAFLNEG
jgi:proline iminopeptidase